MGISGSLSLVNNMFTGVEFLISHKIMKYLLGIGSNSIALDFILSSLERIFIFFFLTLLMFLKVSFPFLTMFVANFINIFLFGIIAVSIFFFYQFFIVGLLVLSLFYYLFLTNNEFFLFLLSLLEIFSTMFQSITLSNRLTINIFAGSLLITLITLLLNITILFFSFFSFLVSIFYFIFYAFELGILFIQFNIFLILFDVYSGYGRWNRIQSEIGFYMWGVEAKLFKVINYLKGSNSICAHLFLLIFIVFFSVVFVHWGLDLPLSASAEHLVYSPKFHLSPDELMSSDAASSSAEASADADVDEEEEEKEKKHNWGPAIMFFPLMTYMCCAMLLSFLTGGRF